MRLEKIMLDDFFVSFYLKLFVFQKSEKNKITKQQEYRGEEWELLDKDLKQYEKVSESLEFCFEINCSYFSI